MNSTKWIGFGIGFVVIIVIVSIINPFVIVQAGERGVVLNLGRIDRTLEPGLHWRTPILERVETVDVRTRVIKNEHYVNEEGAVISDNALAAASKDLQDVNVSVVVNYHLDQFQVGDIYLRYGSIERYEEGIIKPLIKDIVKSSTSLYTAEELVTKRSELSTKISEVLAFAIAEKGSVLERTNITNLGFSSSFTAAIEAKVTAEQQALTARNKLEQVKFEAEQRVAQAKAEAEAIRIQAQAITQQGGRDYVQLKSIEKWDGQLPVNLYGSAPIPFIDIR